MKSRDLARKLEDASEAILAYVSPDKYDDYPESDDDRHELIRAATKLRALMVLLPPRGPTSSSSCPKCGYQLTIT